MKTIPMPGRRAGRTVARLQAQCDEFNRLYPVGTVMRAWSGLMHDGPGAVGQVREPGAYVLSGHTPVVHLSGVKGGCISLTHVQAEP